jgi:FKBP-type peptidyl-prolyl cis-trans isomerase FklB
MKQLMIVLLVISSLAIGQTTKKSVKKQNSKAKQKVEQMTEAEKLSYALGYSIGGRVMGDFQKNQIDITPEAFVKGFGDMLMGNKLAISDSEGQVIMMKFQTEMQAKQQAAQQEYKEMLDKNKKEGDDFLAENGKKDSIKTTMSGLQYKIISEGKGKSPVDTSTVVVNYRGRLIDGTVFDDSYKRGEPLTIQLNQVIKGWTEGMQLLKEGGKAELYIPSNLGYGERGSGQTIMPNSALVFEVELVEVK